MLNGGSVLLPLICYTRKARINEFADHEKVDIWRTVGGQKKSDANSTTSLECGFLVETEWAAQSSKTDLFMERSLEFFMSRNQPNLGLMSQGDSLVQQVDKVAMPSLATGKMDSTIGMQ